MPHPIEVLTGQEDDTSVGVLCQIECLPEFTAFLKANAVGFQQIDDESGILGKPDAHLLIPREFFPLERVRALVKAFDDQTRK